MYGKLLVYNCNLTSAIPSVCSSSCGEKVEVGRNFEAYQGKFRGGRDLGVGLMQTKTLVFSLKVPLVCVDVVDVRTGLSIVFVPELHLLIEEQLSVWLPKGCRISQERRKRTFPKP